MVRSWILKCAGAAGLPGPARIVSDFRSRLSLLTLTIVSGALAVLAVTGLCLAAGIPLSHLTRDSVEILKAPWYYGALSNLGFLVWSASAVACFFGAAILSRRTRDREWVGFLLALGSLTAILVLDDVFLLHEIVLPALLGVRQRFIMLGYVLLAGLFLVRFRKLILKTEYPVLVAALGLFSLSVLSDGAQTRIDLPSHHAIEDGGKMLGILAWTVYSVRVSMQRVLGALERRIARPDSGRSSSEASTGPLWGDAQQPGTVERRRPVRDFQSPQSAGEWRL